jgi:murein L,D-transpeptidase YcbB/YkuD
MSAPAFGQTPAAADAPDSAPGQAAPAKTPQAPAETPEASAQAPQNTNPAATEGLTRPASKLEELITTRGAQFNDRKSEQAAVEAFYRERGFQPIWSANGTALPRTRAAVEYLAKVAFEGLDPRDYPTPDFSRDMSEETAAANELQLTASVLKYARHASAGRVSFTRVSGAILYPPHAADPAQVLAQVSSAENVEEVLASFEPQHPHFKALQGHLAKELSGATPPPVIENSKRHDKTDAARPRSDVTSTLIANLERWRWLPRDLGNAYVMVNVPDYTLSVTQNGKPIWRTKIVVGKPGDLATPLLSEAMKYLTINPTWNVPPSIIRNEYLPALERDPRALERIGLKVSHDRDGSIRVYQPPGDRNALGRIRFNFPNPFLVYQHDTPNKHLFEQDERALSHGCMRVQSPEQYAEVLLSLSQPNEGFTPARIRSLYGDDERIINLKQPIPVHVTYQTAFVDQTGQLILRADIYGLDAAVLKLLRGSERLIADTPIPRNYSSSSKSVVARLPSRSIQRYRQGYRQEHRQEYGWNNGGGWNNGSGWNSGNGWNSGDRWNNNWNNGRGGYNSYAADPSANRYFGRNW